VKNKFHQSKSTKTTPLKIKERRRQDVCDDEQGVQQQAGYLTETRKY